MKLWYVEIVGEGDVVAHRLGPYNSEHLAEKADSGANINLNHEKYSTRVVEEDDDPA